VAETLNILAVVLDDVGQYEEAEVLCRRALAIRTAVVDAAAAQGPEHQTTIQLELASSLGNLAALLQRKTCACVRFTFVANGSGPPREFSADRVVVSTAQNCE
jgi:hypothetical protein